MLVIHGIELVVGQQLQQVRELEGRHTSRLEQQCEAGDEIIDVRHMRQHVVRSHQIDLPAFSDQLGRHLPTEESFDDINTLGAGSGRRACGRLHPKTGYVSLLNVLQQVAVVGCDFCHQAVTIQAEAAAHGLHVGLGVSQPGA